MARAPQATRTPRGNRSLTYAAGLLAGGVGLSAVYAATGLGVPCPFRLLTGWDCPLCGSTRMGAALLHADVAAAYGYNPVVLVALTVLGGLGALRLVEAAGGPAVRLPARWAAALRRVGSVRWLAVGLLIAAGWTLVRNLG